MTAVYIDAVKEAAYEIWLETHKSFCAVDIYGRLCRSYDHRSLPSLSQIGRMLVAADWAETKKRSGLRLSEIRYVWRGE